MRKGISLLALLLILFLSPVYAAELTSVSQVMDNITYKFTYAFLGRDALLWVVSSEHDALISAATDAQLVASSAPFNSDVYYTYVMPLMIGIYIITATYFFVRLTAFVTEYLWLTKKQGTPPMGSDAFREFLLRFVLVGGMILAPVVTSSGVPVYSAHQRVVMEVFSESVSFSDDALIELVDSQRQALVTTKLPSSESKLMTAKAVTSFFVCVRGSARHEIKERNVEVAIERDLKKKEFKAVVNAGGCNLKLTMGMDVASDEQAKTLRGVMTDFLIDEGGMLEAQNTIFPELVKLILDKGDHFSEVIAKPIQDTVQVNKDDPDVLKQQYAMKVWTKDVLQEKDIVNWESNCDAFSLWRFPNERITDRDRVMYAHMSNRCISYEIANKLLYPENETNITEFLSSNILLNRQIPVCRQSLLNLNGKVAEYDAAKVLLNNPADTLVEADKVSLDGCIEKLCSDQALKSGGLYMCSKAVSLYDRGIKDDQMKRKGVMSLGAYMFSMFTHPQLSDSAKAIFNGVSGDFSNATFSKDASKQYESFPIQLPPETAMSMMMENKYIRTYMQTYSGHPEVIAPLLPDVTKDDLAILKKIGFGRLSTCTQNPLHIVDGYVCGNVAQELSFFGKLLMDTAIDLKFYVALSRVMFSGGDGQSKGGSVSSMMSPKILKNASMIMPSLPFDRFTNFFFGGDDNMVDSFGAASKEDYQMLILGKSPLAAMLLYAASNENEAISNMISAALITMFAIGVFSAIVLPFVPVMLFMYALGKMVFLLFKLLTLNGIKMVDVVFEESPDIFVKTVDQIWADHLALFLKLPLTLIGVIMAWLLSNAMINKISEVLNLGVLYSSGNGLSLTGAIDSIAIVLVTLVVMFLVFNMIMSIIESFYDFTVEWLMGSMTSDPFSENAMMRWKDSKSSLAFMSKSGKFGAGGLPGGG